MQPPLSVVPPSSSTPSNLNDVGAHLTNLDRTIRECFKKNSGTIPSDQQPVMLASFASLQRGISNAVGGNKVDDQMKLKKVLLQSWFILGELYYSNCKGILGRAKTSRLLPDAFKRLADPLMGVTESVFGGKINADSLAAHDFSVIETLSAAKGMVRLGYASTPQAASCFTYIHRKVVDAAGEALSDLGWGGLYDALMGAVLQVRREINVRDGVRLGTRGKNPPNSHADSSDSLDRIFRHYCFLAASFLDNFIVAAMHPLKDGKPIKARSFRSLRFSLALLNGLLKESRFRARFDDGKFISLGEMGSRLCREMTTKLGEAAEALSNQGSHIETPRMVDIACCANILLGKSGEKAPFKADKDFRAALWNYLRLLLEARRQGGVIAPLADISAAHATTILAGIGESLPLLNHETSESAQVISALFNCALREIDKVRGYGYLLKLVLLFAAYDSVTETQAESLLKVFLKEATAQVFQSRYSLTQAFEKLETRFPNLIILISEIEEKLTNSSHTGQDGSIS